MRPALLMILLLAACTDKPGDDTGPVDADADGYAADVDCNDKNSAVHPGAAEVCDGVDNDCDGKADGRYAADAATWYADIDGDGYGDSLYPRQDCVQPIGHVENSADCDDSLAEVSPAGEERCNDIDDDCDGLVDEEGGSAPTWFIDADGDGYGSDADTVQACAAPTGYVDNDEDCNDDDDTVSPGAAETWYDGVDGDCDGGSDYDQDGDGYDSDAHGGADCDDLDAARYPTTYYADADSDGFGDASAPLASCDTPAGHVLDATDCDDSTDQANPSLSEVCGDGIDNDCDGAGTGCGLMGDTSVVDSWATLAGVSVNALVGDAARVVGDLDGDGLPDLALGGLGSSTGGAGAGVAYLVTGVPSGRSSLGSVGIRLLGLGGEGVGGAIEGLEDQDGDGFDELAVGAPSSIGAGNVYLLQGPVPGAGGSLSALASAVLAGPAAGSLAGSTLATGDFTGDGVADLLVGAAGDATVYLEAGPITAGRTLGAGEAEISGLSSGAGMVVSAAGDLDGDGFEDFVLSEPGSGTAGQVHLFFGPLSGALPLTAADASWTGSASGAVRAVAGGRDTDGDGLHDLVLGAEASTLCGTGCGTAWLLLGPTTAVTSLSNADAILLGSSGSAFGSGVALGDVDGDGIADVAVGAQSSGVGGAIHLFVGPLSGTVNSTAADGRIFTPFALDDLGASLSLGDVDGDGTDDVVGGAPRFNGGAINSGGAFLLMGGAGL